MSEQPPAIHQIASGEIEVWIDPAGIICLKSRNEFGDPVELAEHEAIELAELLTRLVNELRS